MRTRLCSAVLACSIALAAAAAVVPVAGAAETWLPAVDLSRLDVTGSGADVAVDQAGNTTVSWLQQDNGSYRVQVATRPAGQAWTDPVTLSPPGQSATSPQVVAGGDRVTVVWTWPDAGYYRTQSSTRTSGGGWSPAESISLPGGSAIDARVAVDASGQVTATWLRYDGSNFRAQASTRALTGTWSAPTTLSDPGQDASTPDVAVNAAGTAVAVWGRFDGTHSRIQQSTRSTSGDWSIPTAISDPGLSASSPQVVGSDAGEFTVTWRMQVAGVYRAQSSSRPAGGSWSVPATLSAADAGLNTAPELAVDDTGTLTAVWVARVANDFRVQSSRRQPQGAWSSPENLSPPAVTPETPSVTAGPQGITTVVWAQGTAQNRTIQAVGRRVAEPWGSPVTLSAATASFPAIALDSSGNAFSVWTLAPAGGGTTRVQGAALDTAGPVVTGFVAPSSATAGQPAALSLAAYDVWSAVAGTTWSFGDGSTASGAAVSHTWSAPGTYTVTATVADAVGNTTTRSSTITVGAAPGATPARPAVSKLKLKPGTIHLTGPKKDRRAKVTVTVTTASRLTLTFRKLGVKKPLRLAKNLTAGKNAFTLTAKLGKKKRLTIGTWKVTAVAKNAAGSSTAKKLTLKVVR
ncbi:PKD domain-containing protein [Nocardioides oleivorans]|uniref:PKD domain-containing protein n=1 Tax=Nocardioides oleivorans TaxID=273676 RepID=A0A4Q2S3R8_9ACTN|nr:PKD domain-containing protein [Nocardioides oleivorans]RYB95084.1 PKD domain-containing protein [Nocardioides oleivorans]